MDLSNSTVPEEFGFILAQEKGVFSEVVRAAWYTVAGSMSLINASIAFAFLVQKVRRGVRLSPSGLLVLNLVFADAFLGAVLFFLSTLIGVKPYVCGIWSGVLFSASIGSRFALINVVLDRFIAIVYSLQYRGWVTTTRSRVMLICGWSVPFAGLVWGIASNDWNHKSAKRCSEIRYVSVFLRYVWVPSLVVCNLCVIILQCSVYLHLRRQDTEKATSYSHKAARILLWIVTPTCVALLSYDIMIIIVVPKVNWILRLIYSVLLLCVELSFLMNPVVYSYSNANVKKPVSDLCKDIKMWLCPSRAPTSCAPGVFVIGPESRTNTNTSFSSVSINDY